MPVKCQRNLHSVKTLKLSAYNHSYKSYCGAKIFLQWYEGWDIYCDRYTGQKNNNRDPLQILVKDR